MIQRIGYLYAACRWFRQARLSPLLPELPDGIVWLAELGGAVRLFFFFLLEPVVFFNDIILSLGPSSFQG